MELRKSSVEKINTPLNVADLPHDPNEVLQKSVEEIQYEWSLG